MTGDLRCNKYAMILIDLKILFSKSRCLSFSYYITFHSLLTSWLFCPTVKFVSWGALLSTFFLNFKLAGGNGGWGGTSCFPTLCSSSIPEPAFEKVLWTPKCTHSPLTHLQDSFADGLCLWYCLLPSPSLHCLYFPCIPCFLHSDISSPL